MGRLLGSVLRLARSTAVRLGFLALALAFALWAVWRDRAAVAAALDRLGTGTVLVVVVVTLLHVGAAGAGWRSVLADLGSPLPAGAAARVFLVGQLARYVPGSVWQLFAVAEAGATHGIARVRTAGASVVALLVSVVTGVGVVVLLGPVLVLDLPWWVAVSATPLPLVVLHPSVLNRVFGLVVRVAGRPPLAGSLSGAGVARATAWAAAAWALLGAQVYVLAVGLGAPAGVRTAAACTAGFVVAWLAGLLVVFAPAGVGVREVVLAALLAGLLAPGAVILLVLMARVLLTVVEIASAATVFAYRSRPSPTQDVGQR